MIKFKCIIHKETGTVIKYEDWLRKFNANKLIRFEDREYYGEWSYKPKDMIFLDDFEIIYDSEFTTEELDFIHDNIGECERLQSKVYELIRDREYIEYKYKIKI